MVSMMLVLFLSIFVKVEAPLSHIVVSKGHELGICFVVSSFQPQRWKNEGPKNPCRTNLSQVRVLAIGFSSKFYPIFLEWGVLSAPLLCYKYL
jgi:hypothetical protein